MNTVGEILSGKLAESVPLARILWEEEPEPEAPGLGGSVLTVNLHGKKLTMRFEGATETAKNASERELLDVLVSLDDIVDDFVSFFSTSIYKKERFTRVVAC